MQVESAPFTPSLCQCSIFQVLKATATGNQRKIGTDVGVTENRTGDLKHIRQRTYQLRYTPAPIYHGLSSKLIRMFELCRAKWIESSGAAAKRILSSLRHNSTIQ